MAQILKDIGKCKSAITNALLKNSDIMELLLGKNYTLQQKNHVVYQQIFPYLYVDETQIETKSYICYEVNVPRIPTATIKDVTICIWCFCHKDIMQVSGYTKNGYHGSDDRVDILADMVEETLRDSDDFGIGKLHLDSVSYVYPNKITYGRQLIYTIADFKYGK